MKRIIWIICICFCTSLQAQQPIPLPVWCFPLNGESNIGIAKGGNILKIDGICSIPNRLNEENMAIGFNKESGSLQLPLLSDGLSKSGITLSFWMYAGPSDSGQVFYGKDKSGKLILGMEKQKEYAVLNMYHILKDGTLSADRLRMWDEVNFAKDTGWYFVSLSFSGEGTMLYLVTPQGKFTSCYSAFVMDWKLLASWGLGSANGTAVRGIDDFRIYTVPLGKEEVRILYDAESRISVGPYEIVNEKTYCPLTLNRNSIGDTVKNASRWWIFSTGSKSGKSNYLLMTDCAGNEYIGMDTYNTPLLSPRLDEEWNLLWTDMCCFNIQNVQRGTNMTDTENEVLLTSADATSGQKWHLKPLINMPGQDGQEKAYPKMKEKQGTQEVFYDREIKMIRVNLRLAKAEDVKIRLYDANGKLNDAYVKLNARSVECNLRPTGTGAYIVAIQSGSDEINKKIIVNF